ncbi:uncharacterized protein [Drosophila tropicalis]|uniref:uncharacterized protein n=1 Tax=Drosophila tropicalis TaxID=46794 RepID=UPI0035AC19C5
MESIYSSLGYVRAKIGDMWYYSCYLAPSLRLTEFERIIDSISADASSKQNVIIAGDFNAWSEEWGSSSSNARGRTLLESWAILDIAVLNTGSKHTFSRAGCGSVIDVTFTSACLFPHSIWKLCDFYTGSDHLAIICSINRSAHQMPNQPRTDQGGQAFRVDTLNPSIFTSALNIPRLDGDASSQADTIMDAVRAACNASMKARRGHSRHRAPCLLVGREHCGGKEKVSSC